MSHPMPWCNKMVFKGCSKSSLSREVFRNAIDRMDEDEPSEFRTGVR